MEKDLKKKKSILIIGIISLVIILLGSTYAFFTYSRSQEAFTLTNGSIEATFTSGTNSVNFQNAYPISDSFAISNLDKLTYIDFTVSSNISNSNQAVSFEIYLEENTTNTLSSDYVKLYLTDDTNTKIQDPVIYSSLENTTYTGSTNGKVIYKGSNTGEFTSNYRLYVWLDSSYSQNDVSQTFSFKVNIYAYNDNPPPPPTTTTTLKENVVSYMDASASDFAGGLVAINGTEGDNYGLLYNETDATQTIREYRYVGPTVNNYIYYNCPDTAGGYSYGDLDYDYQTNCEVWRIVGIFKETKEDGTEEEYLKIMRNTTFAAGSVPTSYTYNGTTYSIASSATSANVYWNSTKVGTNYNDWRTAGLQYYLNTKQDESTTPVAGYLSTLSTTSKNLIRETTYHLGNVVHGSSGDTTLTAYDNERDENNKWDGNEASWNGPIALLYPSDYGYSADSSYWSETTLYNYDAAAAATSWMQQTANHSSNEWLLSPTSDYSDNAMVWCSAGFLNYGHGVYYYIGARPVLNLKSQTEILKGDGTSNSPYVVIEI